MRKSNKKGFTLVELVVVIAIIGILAAILVPTMMNYVKKARLKTANANAKLIFTTCNNEASDLIADGDTVNVVSYSWQKVSGLNDKDPLQKAVKVALRDNGSGDSLGYCAIEFDPSVSETSTTSSNVALWSSSSDGLVTGRYPEPIKKVANAKLADAAKNTTAKTSANKT